MKWYQFDFQLRKRWKQCYEIKSFRKFQIFNKFNLVLHPERAPPRTPTPFHPALTIPALTSRTSTTKLKRRQIIHRLQRRSKTSKWETSPTKCRRQIHRQLRSLLEKVDFQNQWRILRNRRTDIRTQVKRQWKPTTFCRRKVSNRRQDVTRKTVKLFR